MMDQIPAEVIQKLELRSKFVIMQLRAFFDKKPDLGDICSFDELRQSYQGTVDDRTLVYNFANLNFSEDLKKDMVEFIAS